MRVLRLGLLVVAIAPGAFAQTPTEGPAQAPAAAPVPTSASDTGTYALAWVRDEGAEGCPTGRELEKDVAQRLGRSPFDPTALRSIEIRVERTATGFRSRVLVRGADGAVLGRRMLSSDEPTCASLFSATALAVALLIDPDAALRGSGTTPVAEFVAPEPAPPPPPSPPKAPGPPAPVAESKKPARARGEVASSALLGAFALGIVPGSTAGAGLHIAGRPTPHWGWAVTALYLTPSEALEEGVSLSVGLTGAGAFATFRPLAQGASLSLEAGPWIGALQARVLPATGALSTDQPSGVVPSSPGDLLFLAVSAGAGLEAHVTPAVFITVRALLLAPLIRHQMTISESSRSGTNQAELWTQPPVGGLFSTGVGLSFF
jgi:hypothetical protein